MENRSIRRDLLMLFFGAMLSFVTSITTTYLNKNEENKNKNKEVKLTFIKELAEDFGQRIYATEELFLYKYDRGIVFHDSTLYFKSKNTWNIKMFYYTAFISYYFPKYKNEYTKKNYKPLCDLGKRVNDNKKNNIEIQKMKNDIDVLKKENTDFIKKLCETLDSN